MWRQRLCYVILIGTQDDRFWRRRWEYYLSLVLTIDGWKSGGALGGVGWFVIRFLVLVLLVFGGAGVRWFYSFCKDPDLSCWVKKMGRDPAHGLGLFILAAFETGTGSQGHSL